MSDPLAPIAVTLLDELELTAPTIESLITQDKPPIEQVRKSDMLLFNFNLAVLHSLWDKIETMPAAFAMIDKQMDLIKKRREILGLEYGSHQNTTSKNVTWEPIP